MGTSATPTRLHLSRLFRRLSRHSPYFRLYLLLLTSLLICLAVHHTHLSRAPSERYEAQLARARMAQLEGEEGGVAEKAISILPPLDSTEDDEDEDDEIHKPPPEHNLGAHHAQTPDDRNGNPQGSAAVPGWIDTPSAHNLSFAGINLPNGIPVNSVPLSFTPTRAPRVSLDGRVVARDLAIQATSCYSGSDHAPPFCAPAILVAGMPRSSSSAMFYKLSLHSGTVSKDDGFVGKEACPKDGRPEHVWKWLQGDGVPLMFPHRSHAKLVAACYEMTTSSSAMAELVRLAPSLKVVAVVRNFADLVYSDFSYRCKEDWDGDCDDDNAESEGWRTRRTATNFHEIVTKRDPAFRKLQLPLALYRPWLERLIAAVGRERVMVVKQEDMAFRSRHTLEYVAEFTDLEVEGFAEEAFSLVSNAQGMEKRLAWLDPDTDTETVESLLNAGSEMSEETRRILDGYWKGECEWLKNQLGVRYSSVC